jgi:TfoX/Sxy family transcriptional regulator of competence genes
MPYDNGLAARVQDALARLDARDVRQKNVFGGRGFLRRKRTFVVVWEDGLLVKLLPDAYEPALREPGVTPFAPDGGRPMSTWVVVAGDVIADDPELLHWVERGLRSVTQ